MIMVLIKTMVLELIMIMVLIMIVMLIMIIFIHFFTFFFRDDYFRMKLQWKTISPEQEKRFATLRERKGLIGRKHVVSFRAWPWSGVFGLGQIGMCYQPRNLLAVQHSCVFSLCLKRERGGGREREGGREEGGAEWNWPEWMQEGIQKKDMRCSVKLNETVVWFMMLIPGFTSTKWYFFALLICLLVDLLCKKFPDWNSPF